jgi:glycine/D-amino acid oxidase-like deaminating enzyme
MNGVYVATAHNCWGILNAPASGQALAELISTGTTNSIDLAPFDPGRFTAPGEARAPFYHRA